MVNTRDEPHADPDSFRRLHVIIGDSNRSQWSTWMKLAVTHLVLCAIEDAFRHGVPSGFEQYAFADPAAANRTVSRFLDNPRAELTLESGESVSALGLQRRYYAAVKAFIETHGDALASSLPATTIDTIMGEWSRVLDALERGAYDALADRVDWAAKKRLFDALKRRRPDVTFAQMEQLELDYHDIANGRLYGSLVARNQMRELLTGDNVEYAVHNPPTDTRAALRGPVRGRGPERRSPVLRRLDPPDPDRPRTPGSHTPRSLRGRAHPGIRAAYGSAELVRNNTVGQHVTAPQQKDPDHLGRGLCRQ